MTFSSAYSFMEKRWIPFSPDWKQQPICFVIEFRNRKFPLINTELHLSQPFSMINCILNMATARKKPKGCWKIILLCNYQYPLRTLSKWINEGIKVLLIKWIHQKIYVLSIIWKLLITQIDPDPTEESFQIPAWNGRLFQKIPEMCALLKAIGTTL